MSFFWLKYRYPDGQFAGAVAIEATGLIIARLEASVFGLDDGLVFAGGHKMDDAIADQIPESMIDRLLDHRDIHRLRRLCLIKKPPGPVKNRPRRKQQRQSGGEPPAPSARRRTTAKRRVGN